MKNVNNNREYELAIIYSDGAQILYPRSLSMLSIMRDITLLTHRLGQLPFMLRLFGPHGDGEWGFIKAWIVNQHGVAIEHDSVTMPEPFMSGKPAATQEG